MFRPAAAVYTLAAVVSFAFPAVAADPELEPRAVIEKTAESVIAVLRQDALSMDERLKKIEGIVYERFDLQTMSRLVLGRDWKRFSDAQREEYVREFKVYLSNYYGKRIDSYNQEQVEIVEATVLSRGDTRVRTRLVGGEVDGVVVDYRLRRSEGGEWLVIDITIEGITLVSNFRDQFAEVVKRDGPDGLIRALKEKNQNFAEEKGQLKGLDTPVLAEN